MLEYLAGNLHDVAIGRPSGTLDRREVKTVAKALLEGLDFLHRQNRVHTGMS